MDTTSRGCLLRSPPSLQPRPSRWSGNHPGRLDDSFSPRLTPKWAGLIRHARPTHRREEALPDFQRILHCHARVSSGGSLTTHVADDYLGFSPRTSVNYTAGSFTLSLGYYWNCWIWIKTSRIYFERERGKCEETDQYCWRQLNRHTVVESKRKQRNSKEISCVFSNTNPTL